MIFIYECLKQFNSMQVICVKLIKSKIAKKWVILIIWNGITVCKQIIIIKLEELF